MAEQIIELQLRDYNKKPHFDIEKAVQERKNGVLTFIVKVASGNITDIVFMDNANYGSK